MTQIWPSQGGRQLVAATDQMGYPTQMDNIQVAAGDMIRFEVHSNGDKSTDAVSWTPSVGYVVDPSLNAKSSDPQTHSTLSASTGLMEAARLAGR